MLLKILTFFVLTAIYFIWYVVNLIQKKDSSHLLFSFIVTCIPFQMSFPVYVPAYLSVDGIGSFTGKIFLMLPLIASLALLVMQKNRNLLSRYRNERWLTWILLLIAISLANPFNVARWGTVAFAVTVISYILFFRLIYNKLNPLQILNGIFASFLFLCVLNFCLAVLYPVLGITFVTTIFQAGGDIWATRNGTRAGAIGIFVTPANLGLFSVIASGFFFASYLNGIKKRLSIIVLILTGMTIILTYSRTSYITFVVILITLLYLSKNAGKPLLSLKSFFLGVLPAAVVLYWLVFLSPFSATFLKTDADDMYQARLDHWTMGMDIFRRSPLIGVGINSHLEFVNRSPEMSKVIHNDFLTSNPIHNTHLIILAETGILGFSLWVIFILTTINRAKVNIAQNVNTILALSEIALIIIYIIYGFTDWAPVSHSTFPIFLLFTYFFYKYSGSTRPAHVVVQST
ncbi:O-antigen ligase family protein [Mucilaginibacter rubeus]|uniref:O-antigen ligase family protein n=1 Tax=Mucilaginibacter rubeus TaxID=2027860 RepID=A0AAE6JBG8_9SPHI|nr:MULTISPECIES: O-antigen ligase family protein [Mucilaginibacter]QEM02515.1 O-antigen ligase family protein [Mucilaginibacter rubeus]QEM15135.1 O-antigen ligase family protein [Mucilaginibacter gossypii]QTE42142.1 O-antigen ligase family protein [Mucilaginibacter rubeus]QTE48743.1 O-antigen ligase family protein [Mucilaginibacter rubeus]QTE53841.1 O-antigen ligase family protein [Mucilaginibacter rubeus]